MNLTSASSPSPQGVQAQPCPPLPAGPGLGAGEPGLWRAEGLLTEGVSRPGKSAPIALGHGPSASGGGGPGSQLSRVGLWADRHLQNGFGGSHQALLLIARILTAARCRREQRTESPEGCCCSVAKSCPILHDPMDCSPPASPTLHHLRSSPACDTQQKQVRRETVMPRRCASLRPERKQQGSGDSSLLPVSQIHAQTNT